MNQQQTYRRSFKKNIKEIGWMDEVRLYTIIPSLSHLIGSKHEIGYLDVPIESHLILT